MTPEVFGRFLQLLSADPEEAGQRYTRLHKKLFDYFSFKGITDSEDAADETIDRAVTKVDGGAIVPDVEKYCFGIARNIARERLRLLKRQNTAFQGYLDDLNNSSAEQVERIYTLLQPCFEALAPADRDLLLMYCREIQGRARAEHRRQVAATLNLSMLALRVRVTRLRSELMDCVRKRVKLI